jgi:seryl-tRNA synthetase
MAKKSVALQKVLEESNKLQKLQAEANKKAEEVRSMATSLTDEDLKEVTGEIDVKIAKLEEQKKALQKEKRELLKKVLPAVPRTKSGSWNCDVVKKGKDTLMTITHTASKKPFEKKFVGNGEEIRKAYIAMRNTFIKHFEGVASQRAAESFMTNTVRPKLGIA